MKPLALILAALPLALAACTTTGDQNTAIGALTGAAVGAAVSDDDDTTKGALAGAAVGAIAGTLIGQSSTPGRCIYRDAYGNRFTAACR